MRKHLKLLLTVLLVGVLMYGGDAGKCRAAEVETINGCTYDFDATTGTLTVSGEGTVGQMSKWEDYKSLVKEIVIKEGITEIGSGAFFECNSVTFITLPDGLKTIGGQAFYGCKKLDRIEIPETVTEIGGWAFFECNSVISIALPNELKTIGSSVFYGCMNLEEITIPDGVTEIGNSAFCGCKKLERIDIPKTVTEIGGSAFFECNSVTSIALPNELKTIGEQVFYGCKKLKTIEIPETVTEIGNSAFSGCSNATSITLPEGLKTIGGGAFSGCENLEKIEIPDTVTEIGDSAFSGCSNATSINLPEGLKTIGSSAFSSCEKLENINIPTTVTEIGDSAFYYHSASVIKLPDSLEDIGERAFDDFGDYWGNLALIVCSNDKQKSYCQEQGYCCVEKSSMPVDLSTKGKITLNLDENIYTGEPQEPYEMFVTCEDPSGQTEKKIFLREDKDYTVEYEPNNIDAGMVTIVVKGIGNYKGTVTSKFPIYKDLTSKDITCELEYKSASYTGKQIKPKVTVKDKGRVLVEGTDYEVSYKNNINPGQATVTIKGKPLEGRRYGIYQEEITAHYTIHGISIKPAKITLDETIFTYDGSGKKPHVTVTLQGKTLKEGVDYVVSYRNNIVAGTAYAEIHGTGLYEGDISTSYTILPGGSGSPAVYDKDDTLISGNLIYTITDDEDLEVEVAGVSNKKLKRLVIPSTIKAEGKKYKVTSVGHKAFYKNSKLVSVVIGNNVESIEDNAFYGCKNVNSIKMGKSVEIIGTSAFRKCTKLASIVLPKSIDKLGKNAFYGCKKLKSITINANSVIDISTNAVKGISKKAVIKVPKKLLKKYRKKLKAKTGFKKTMKIKKK